MDYENFIDTQPKSVVIGTKSKKTNSRTTAIAVAVVVITQLFLKIG